MLTVGGFNCDKFRGLDLQLDPLLTPSAFATSAHNVSFTRRVGGLKAAYGFSRVAAQNPGGSTGACLGFTTFLRGAGADPIQVARGPRGYYYRIGTTSTWTTLLEFGSSTPWAKPHFVQYYDRLWIVDGIGIWSWDGYSATLKAHVGSTAGRRNWPPWGTQFICKHFERLWTGGFAGAPGRIVHSEIGAQYGADANSTPNTVTFSTLNLFNIGRQDKDDPITALLPQEGQVSNLLVFKKKSLWTIAGNDAATFDVDMLARVGCVGSRAAAMCPGYAYWLDKGKLYRFNGIDALDSVSHPIAEHLYSRVYENPGYTPKLFYSDNFSAKTTARHVFQASAQWAVSTASTYHVHRLVSSFTSSTNAGMAFSIPCNSHLLYVRFRLPGTSTHKQRIFFRFRAPTDNSSADNRGYWASFGSYAWTGLGSVLASNRLTVFKCSSAAGNMTKLASVNLVSADFTDWMYMQIQPVDNRIIVSLTPEDDTTKAEQVTVNDTDWLDPRSTMWFGWRAYQASTTSSHTITPRIDKVRVWFFHCNTYNQLGYSPADNTLHVVTASTDALPQAKPLVFDLQTEDWATRGYSVACLGTHKADGYDERLAVALRPTTSTDGRFRRFDRNSGYYGQAMSSYWRSHYLTGRQESAQQILQEVHIQFERAAGKRMHLFISGGNGPYVDRGPSRRTSFMMNDVTYRQNMAIQGPFFRVTLAGVGSSTSCSFNVSRINLVTGQTGRPSRWETR